MNEKSFVREVAARADCDERRAEALIFAVFQELRDRLTPNEAAKVAAKLPTSLKMLWMSFDRPDRQVRRVHEPQFLYFVRRRSLTPSRRPAAQASIAGARFLARPINPVSASVRRLPQSACDERRAHDRTLRLTQYRPISGRLARSVFGGLNRQAQPEGSS